MTLQRGRNDPRISESGKGVGQKRGWGQRHTNRICHRGAHSQFAWEHCCIHNNGSNPYGTLCHSHPLALEDRLSCHSHHTFEVPLQRVRWQTFWGENLHDFLFFLSGRVNPTPCERRKEHWLASPATRAHWKGVHPFLFFCPAKVLNPIWLQPSGLLNFSFFPSAINRFKQLSLTFWIKMG